MALLQDILGQLTTLGFGTEEQEGSGLDYMSLANISPSQIATAMQTHYGIPGENLPEHLFSGISTDILEQGLGKTYSPQIEAGGSSLLGQLQETLGGKQARQAYGGFAGSGQASRFKQGAKDVYGKGMSDVLSKVSQQRSQGLSNVQDVINQWRQAAMDIQY